MDKFRITSLPQANSFDAVRSKPDLVPAICRKANERVHTLSADKATGTLSIESEVQGTDGIWMPAGYYFVQCIEGPCESEHIVAFQTRLYTAFSGRIPGRFGEVRPILVASSYTQEAQEIMASWTPNEEWLGAPELYESTD